ncbi:AraC family transcriptional regulator [Streptomyces hoynatensis]|uniref:AraC family transcriptional regulator n=1 Tax=Streptomyces hoynatensis TaxID=1141874 RepID=A0A3A9YP08_9ACTN|nr:AraC family transcriptional regulator [Streptomyces hoynatensis]RKN37793.1 AraC family transcriptional regulator [Streptomyces hoynatensis]
MDVLSDAVAAMRAGRPHSGRQWLHAPWRLSAPEFGAGAGFHVVLRGGCRLLLAGAEPLWLGVGDLVLLPHGSAHQLADARGGEAPPGRLLTLGDPASGAPAPVGPAPVEPAPVGPEAAGPAPGGPAGAAEGGVAGEGPTVLLCGAYLLDRARPHPLLASLPPVVHLRAGVGHHPALRGTIELLGAELAEPGRPGGDGVVPALLETLLLYALRAWYEDAAREGRAGGWSAALRDPAVSAALRALHANPARSWTVRDLGAEAGLSRAPFARRFAELVGRPPLAYLTWWRMVSAARLLRQTETPIRGVAERVGYASEFAFAKAFKREFGLPPGRYRRAAGGEAPGAGPAGGEPVGEAPRRRR